VYKLYRMWFELELMQLKFSEKPAIQSPDRCADKNNNPCVSRAFLTRETQEEEAHTSRLSLKHIELNTTIDPHQNVPQSMTVCFYNLIGFLG